MGRAGENIDLRAGVVDVILALDLEPGLGQQRRERVADDSAPAVADMHWPGRVGRDEFDIDPLAAADWRIAKTGAGAQDRAQLCVPDFGRQGDVQKPRTRRCDGQAAAAVIPGDQLAPVQRSADPFRQRHRVFPDRAGQHHRRIGGEIAMGGIARRLDRDPRQVEPLRQRALAIKIVERGQHEAADIAENIGHLLFSSTPA